MMTPADLKAARKALGLSAEGFARLVGVQSGRTVRRWERGDRDIPGTASKRFLSETVAVRNLLGSPQSLLFSRPVFGRGRTNRHRAQAEVVGSVYMVLFHANNPRKNRAGVVEQQKPPFKAVLLQTPAGIYFNTMNWLQNFSVAILACTG
jgi:transcriptional regulator with XRE-family HTH domain